MSLGTIHAPATSVEFALGGKVAPITLAIPLPHAALV
jgi:hypothetical protein